MGEEHAYDAAHIKVFQGLEAVRRRPGMYVGSTGVRGLHQMVVGVAEQAVNGTVGRPRRTVEVTLLADGGVRVADDGPGIPFDGPADDGGPSLEDRLSHVYAGKPIVDRARVCSWFGGIGPAVVNALSRRTTAEVFRDGRHLVQEFARGTVLGPPAVAGPADRTGTALTFHPDPEIFGTVDVSAAALGERFRQLAFLYPGLGLTLTDERPADGPGVQRYRSPGGVRDHVIALCAARREFPPEHLLAFSLDEPRMAGVLDVALAWTPDGPGRVLGYANGRATPHGGTHLEGFRHGLAAAVTSYARACGPLSGTVPALDPDGVGSGVTAVVSVRLDEPEFVGSTSTALGGDAVRACVEEAVRERVRGWLEDDPERGARVVGPGTG
ncbi:DNA gyrase subunit B [Streptomyces sp. NPDC085529]|uniref:DNA gyrase subunit B n=1 Tax=Streptomyces sp. NPDC085529 TaxID=3365729 RepID=UPI0037D32E1A